MKPCPIFRVLSVFVLLLTGCSNQADQLPKVEVNGTEIPDLDPDLLEPIDVKLSQIAEKLKVVTLETSPECMLTSNVDYLIGEKYIIARDMNGVYQFSIDGSFIRKIITYGRAPGETSVMPTLCLVEDEDMLIAMANGVSGTDNYQFRLSSGGYLGKYGSIVLKSNETLISCRYLGDSNIMFSYYNYTSSPNPDPLTVASGVKIQRMNGEVLFNKEFNYLSWATPGPYLKLLQGSRLYLLSTNDPEEYILQIIDQDTVYKLNSTDYSMEPIFLKRFEKTKDAGIPVDFYVENCTFEEEEFANINGYQLSHFKFFESLEKGFNGRCFVIYDGNKETAYKVGTFKNDYFGFSHSTEEEIKDIYPYLIDPGRKLVEVYDAFTFLQFAGEALKKPDLDPTVKARLLDLTGKVTETSNPVLLIGDMKKKIDGLEL